MTPDPEQTRYRIYRLRNDDLREVAATSRDGIGLAIITTHSEGEWTENDRWGLLDRPDPDAPGKWIVNPWATGRRRKQ